MGSTVSKTARVFGSVTTTDTEAAARESAQKFVRGKYEVSPLNEGKKPPGHILTAWEAYQSYGIDVLDESMEYGGAILLESTGAVERTFSSRRSDLGLSLESVAGAAGVSIGVVKQAEEVARDIPLRELEKIAFVLGLDERLLAFDENRSADRELAFRLKTLQQADVEASGISAGTVLRFTEAASVIRIQSMLMEWLGQSSVVKEFQPSNDYGWYKKPAWQVGYGLAQQTRARLEFDMGNAGPIRSMRDLVERDLGIPVVQAQLQPTIAGATITTKGFNGGEVRGFVLNHNWGKLKCLGSPGYASA